jgi:hypothetical protein
MMGALVRQDRRVSMRIRKCRRCGFPFWLSKMIRWEDNGTIVYTLAPDFRLVLIESDLLGSIFTRIQDELGIPISHLVFEAQRNAVAVGIEDLLSSFPLSLGRIGPNKYIVPRFFCRLSTWLGTALAEVTRYRPGRIGEAIVRNPYNRELMAALILGAFESLEHKPYQHAWKKVDGDDIISVTPMKEKPEVSQRLVLSAPEIRPGSRDLPRCPSCGVPLDLSYLEWHEEEGIVMDRRRSTRMNFIDGYTPGVVFRELEEELGKNIIPLIIKVGKELSHRRLQDLGVRKNDEEKLAGDERESFYEMALASLPLWGQGNPVSFEQKNSSLKVTVDNPYHQYLLAGQIAALFEAAEGVEAEVTWEMPEPSSITFLVQAAT